MNKVLFWDFDGTLSYPNKRFDTALYTALCENGYYVDKEEAVNFLGSVYSWKTPHIDYPEKVGALWWDTFFDKISCFCEKKNISKESVNLICERFKELLTDVSNYQLYADTQETLEKCVKLGYKNYLITNNYPEIVNNLEKLNIASCFTDFVVSSHIGYDKPRREFFDYAARLANFPDIAYVIGDNPIADIQGGKAAGYKTIAVHECKNSVADYYVEKLLQILSIIS